MRMRCLETYDSMSDQLCWCDRCVSYSLAVCFVWMGIAIKEMSESR